MINIGLPPPIESLAFTSYGLRIAISFPKTIPRAAVLAALPPGWTPAPAQDLDRSYQLVDAEHESTLRFEMHVDGDMAGSRTAMSLESILDILEGDIQIYVAEFATPQLFVHAGVVEWRGRAIVLPGSSFAGKSTLVTSLVNAGATYYTDEYAVITADGHVLPYLRRVSLREGPHGPRGRRDLSHRAPVRGEQDRPLPVGLVALLRYHADASWQVHCLEGAAAIMAMCEQTVAIQRRPADTLDILAKVAESAHVIQGTRGDVDDAVKRLLEMDVVQAWSQEPASSS